MLSTIILCDTFHNPSCITAKVVWVPSGVRTNCRELSTTLSSKKLMNKRSNWILEYCSLAKDTNVEIDDTTNKSVRNNNEQTNDLTTLILI